MIYIALIVKEPKTDYWVRTPDIPGCFSDGTTPELALDHFCAALASHIKNPASIVNPPRSLSEIMAKEEFTGLAQIDISTNPPTHSIVDGLVTPLKIRR
jgi:predicted RNase H-like HicB family nuclease